MGAVTGRAIQDDRVRALEAHLAVRAGTYYPDLGVGPVPVALERRRIRDRSAMYTFRVGPSERSHRIVVKVFTATGPVDDVVAGGGRPMLAAPTDPVQRPRLEFDALEDVRSRVGGAGDPRVGALRAFEFLQQYPAIVMEFVDLPTLRDLVIRDSLAPWRGRTSRTADAVRNVGVWLRAYVGGGSSREVWRAGRDDYLEGLDRFRDYLRAELGPGMVGMLQDVRAAAVESLPDQLPVGLAHGDFAARNVFVGPEARVTVFDILSRWRKPIHESLAYFLVSLRTLGPQLASSGLAISRDRLDRLERAFLEGFADGAWVAREPVALFELLVLMDRWSSFVARARLRRGPLSAARAHLGLARPHFRAEAARLMRTVTGR